MHYTTLTGTGLSVSRLCLGGMTFGGGMAEDACRKIVSQSLDAGINFIDTADSYLGGESERILGNILPENRHGFVLASKVGARTQPGPNGDGLSRRRILSQLDATLSRLKTDYLDIYYLHMPDRRTPLAETLSTMDALVRDGRIRYYGVSNYAAWEIVDMLWQCDANGWIAPVVSQNIHNLITRGIERELTPCLKHHHIGLVAYSPLASGMLTGKYRPDAPPVENSRFAVNQYHRDRFWHGFNFSAVERLAAIAAGAGLDLPRFALKWCLQAGADSVSIGVSSPDQLTHSLPVLDMPELSAASLAACDEVWADITDRSFQYNR